MSRRVWFAVVVVVLCLVPALSASAAPDASVELTPGTSHSFQQSADRGFNLNYGGLVPAAPKQVCTKSAETYCDTVLVKLSNPLTQSDIDAGVTSKKRAFAVTVTPSGGATADYDLAVWAADAQGNRVTQIGYSKTGTPFVGGEAITSGSTPAQYILVEVVYWVGLGKYNATVEF
jgi:hypothetical protein